MAILVGITIGAGIYSTPQRIASLQESFYGITGLWVAAGIFVFVAGLIYAELGSRLPNTGGEYVYISRVFGPFAGFIFGWAQLIIIRTSAGAAVSIITVEYLGHFVKMDSLIKTIAGVAVLAFLGLINYVGIRVSSIFQRIFTAAKIIGILFFVIVGLLFVANSEVSREAVVPLNDPDFNPLAAFVTVIFLVIFSYTGWDRVGYVAGEMKNPKKVIPLSMFFGISAVVIIYVLINIMYFETLGMEGMRGNTRLASEAAHLLMGPVGAAFVAILVMISASSSTNGTVMTAPRVYYAMARDGLFFKWLDYVHPRFKTPSRAIIIHCVWASVILIVRSKFADVAAGMVFAILIFQAMVTIALFKLRKAGIGNEGAYKMPFYPILPGLYLTCVIVLLVLRIIYEWENSLIDLAFLASGAVVAFFLRKRIGKEGKSVLPKHETRIMQ